MLCALGRNDLQADANNHHRSRTIRMMLRLVTDLPKHSPGSLLWKLINRPSSSSWLGECELDQVGKLLWRAQSLARIWRGQVKCWDVLLPVPRSLEILVRRQRNYEDPFAQFVSREQSNDHEQQISGDNCMVWNWPVQACRTNTMEPDQANTYRPIIRACTGFFDEWEASVNVHVGHSRLDQTLLSQNQTSCRAQDRLKPIHHFVTNSRLLTIIEPARYKCMDQQNASHRMKLNLSRHLA